MAVGILASLAVVGCDKDSPSTSSTTSTTSSPNRPLLAQYTNDGGMPNPMPGSPLADAGFAPLPPAPGPGPTPNPGNPAHPGGPTYPGTPGNPGSPGSPGSPTPPPGH